MDEAASPAHTPGSGRLARRLALLAGVLMLTVVAVVLLSPQAGGYLPEGVESRLASRELTGGSLTFREEYVARLPFPAMLDHVRTRVPSWEVRFEAQSVEFRGPSGRDNVVVQPGFEIPDARWARENPEHWSIITINRAGSFWDIVRGKIRAQEFYVDLDLRFWGRPDKHGVALKMDQLPDWLSEAYRIQYRELPKSASPAKRGGK